MARKEITKFSGGISPNTKSGLANSFRFAKHLNIFTDDDSVTLNPIPIKVSGSTVVDLVRWSTDVVPYASDKYFYGDTGKMYKETSAGVWSVDRTVSSSQGNGIECFANALYYSTNTTLGRKYPLTGTPSYDDDFLSNGVDNVDVENTSNGHANTYTTPVAISETATNEFIFDGSLILTKDPVKTIALWVTTRGTGNWTVTFHDDLNNVLGTATVTNGSLTNGALNNFTFTTPIRVNLGQEYHFHVTSTVADGTVGTSTASDLSTVYMTEYFGILIDDYYHDIIQHTNGVNGTIVIGNKNYFAEYTTAGAYNPNKISILPGFNIRYFVKENEYVVAMAWKGSDIDDFDNGMAFYWDGISPYYNFSKPITGGLPNASVNYKNRIFSVLGSNGIMTLGTEPFRSIQPMPLLANAKMIEVQPGAITTWQNRAHIGMGTNSDDALVYQGVYEFGNQSDRAISTTSVSSEVLNFGYTISTGDEQGIIMKIGHVIGYGKDMYIGWKSQAGTYGVDKVSKTNDPASTGSWESLIDDDSADSKGNTYSAPQKPKLAQRVLVFAYDLPTGCTITPKYRLDRDTAWTTGTAEQIMTAGGRVAELPINKRYYEIEYGFDVTATTNYPIILSIWFEFEALSVERDKR